MHNPNIKIHSVHLPFLKGVGGGRFEPPTKFSKRGDLTRPQLLERGCLERGGDFFQEGGGGCNFQIKNLKSEIFNGKKS